MSWTFIVRFEFDSYLSIDNMLKVSRIARFI